MSAKSRARHLATVGSVHQGEAPCVAPDYDWYISPEDYEWYVAPTQDVLRGITLDRLGSLDQHTPIPKLHEVSAEELVAAFTKFLPADPEVFKQGPDDYCWWLFDEVTIQQGENAQAAAELFAIHRTVDNDDDPQWYDNLNPVDCLVYGPLGLAGKEPVLTRWTIGFRLNMVVDGPGVHQHRWLPSHGEE